MSKKRYKYCIVPQCKSTTIRTPNKLFFSVPVGENVRREWCLAMGRVPGVHKTLSVKCTRFVCEDHFDVEKDLNNYLKWKMVGVGKLILKKGVLPHKFECQRDKCDGEKNGIPQREKVRQANSDTRRSGDKNKANDKNISTISIGNNIDKENKHGPYRDLDINIKEEVTGNVCVCEQKTGVVVKSEVEDLDDYVYAIKYDSATGGEYLIKVSHTKDLIK